MQNREYKMIEPPIDQLIQKVGNKFILTCLISQRASELNAQYMQGEPMDKDPKVIAIAAEEVLVGKVKPNY